MPRDKPKHALSTAKRSGSQCIAFSVAGHAEWTVLNSRLRLTPVFLNRVVPTAVHKKFEKARLETFHQNISRQNKENQFKFYRMSVAVVYTCILLYQLYTCGTCYQPQKSKFFRFSATCTVYILPAKSRI